MSSFLRPEKSSIKLLYLRLTDSAPLIVAKEKGYFRQFGLDVQLQKETSWATLRDKLIGRNADATAMLAPIPLTLVQALPRYGSLVFTLFPATACSCATGCDRQISIPTRIYSLWRAAVGDVWEFAELPPMSKQAYRSALHRQTVDFLSAQK